MDLFNQNIDRHQNLLPYNGTLNYFGPIFKLSESNKYYNELFTNIAWKQDEAIIYGKKIITARKVAWYGDTEYEYKYSGVCKRGLLWTNTLKELKTIVQDLSNETYNSCLLNLYHNGTEGMAWHSDAEKDLKPNGTVASLSFGANRKFSFKHKKDKQVLSLVLEHGSLLLMKDEIQTHWLHRLPPSTKILNPRINLTFRTIVNHLKP